MENKTTSATQPHLINDTLSNETDTNVGSNEPDKTAQETLLSEATELNKVATYPESNKLSKVKVSRTVVISLIMGGIALAAIYSNFCGTVQLKLGWQGGQVTVQTCKPPS
jgi:hypothetical protein